MKISSKNHNKYFNVCYKNVNKFHSDIIRSITLLFKIKFGISDLKKLHTPQHMQQPPTTNSIPQIFNSEIQKI